MEFSSKINQYQLNQGAGAQSPNPVKNLQKVASTLQELQKGQVFEGTVKNVKGGQAVILLSNGQTLKARMDGKVDLKPGQNMFFQVKSNQNNQIAIRPYMSEGKPLNPTLYKALDAANLPVNQNYLTMVDEMMAEGMSVDSQSLNKMVQLLTANEGADIQVLVQMTKLGLKIDPVSIEQFTNYKNNEQALLHTMNEVADGVGQAIGNENSAQGMLRIHMQIAQLFLESAGQAKPGQLPLLENLLGGNGTSLIGDQLLSLQNGQVKTSPEPLFVLQTVNTPEGSYQTATLNTQLSAGEFLSELTKYLEQVLGEQIKGNAVIVKDGAQITDGMQNGGQPAGAMQNGMPAAGMTQGNGQPAGVLQDISLQAGAQQGQAAETLFQNPSTEANVGQSQAADGTFQSLASGVQQGQAADGTGQGSFAQLSGMEGNISDLGFAGEILKAVFSGKEYQNILKEALLEQWTLTPESVREEGKIEEFYQRLQAQMGKIQQMFADNLSAGAQTAAKGASETLNNMEMMNQINQLYNYVQLPLKLTNQNAHSELYIYTNKKNLREKKGELSALLHLELEHLGNTDIMVKMLGNRVSADFSLNNDKSFALIKNNLDILKRRLELAGYDCQLTVKKEAEKEKKDFVKDFLEKEERVETIRRYSFDVRA
ncbi:MAG: hypothetical protein HFG80_01960 [Eubacterium sp.]|nr:hypothetical protein [Eubacterium sp.]